MARETPQSLKEEQHGGRHYKGMAIQPAEYNQRNELGWCEGEAVKLISRHQNKNGAVDLFKAIHYIKMVCEIVYGVTYSEQGLQSVELFHDCDGTPLVPGDKVTIWPEHIWLLGSEGITKYGDVGTFVGPGPHGHMMFSFPKAKCVEMNSVGIKKLPAEFQNQKGEPVANMATWAIEDLQGQLEGVLEFKAFVHKFLDEKGVPADPYPEETKKTGCRIGGRLKWVFERLQLEKEENIKSAALDRSVEEYEREKIGTFPDRPKGKTTNNTCRKLAVTQLADAAGNCRYMATGLEKAADLLPEMNVERHEHGGGVSVTSFPRSTDQIEAHNLRLMAGNLRLLGRRIDNLLANFHRITEAYRRLPEVSKGGSLSRGVLQTDFEAMAAEGGTVGIRSQEGVDQPSGEAIRTAQDELERRKEDGI